MLETILQAKAFENMVCIPINKVEEYKSSFQHYLKEIVEVIEDLKSKGIYCYNSTVAENCKHLNLDSETLSRFVYNSQSYLHNKSSFEQLEKYKETYKDWLEPTEEKLRDWTNEKHTLSKYKTAVLNGDHSLNKAKAKELEEAKDIYKKITK